MDWEKKAEELKSSSITFKTETVILEFLSIISKYMDKHNLNQKELAKKLEMSNAAVSKLLSGNENISIKRMVEVGHKLGFNISIAEDTIIDNYKNNIKNLREKSFLDILDKQYLETDNKEEHDYLIPLSKIISESIELRNSKGMSQADLAERIRTQQSVISRFENMGGKPNYDFIARLSIALGHIPGMTLCGDYMAVVPIEKQVLVKGMAEKENITTSEFVQNIVDQGITIIENKANYMTTIARVEAIGSFIERNGTIVYSEAFPRRQHFSTMDALQQQLSIRGALDPKQKGILNSTNAVVSNQGNNPDQLSA